MVGQTDMALKLTEGTLKQKVDLCPAIYTLWARVIQLSPTTELSISGIYEQIRQSGCKKP